MIVKNLVEIEGLEPSLTEPDSVVLPLHHLSIWLPFLNWECKGMNVLQKCKIFLIFLLIVLPEGISRRKVLQGVVPKKVEK